MKDRYKTDDELTAFGVIDIGNTTLTTLYTFKTLYCPRRVLASGFGPEAKTRGPPPPPAYKECHVNESSPIAHGGPG